VSRTLSTSALAAINAQETGEVFVLLLSIDVPGGSSIWLTDNSEDVVSRGRTFIGYPFSLELPSDEQGNISEARLSIDNVSRSLIDEIRGLTDALRLTIEIVMASTPDTVEYSANDYLLRDVTYDALTISGTLSQDNFLAEPYPAGIMSAAMFPGLF